MTEYHERRHISIQPLTATGNLSACRFPWAAPRLTTVFYSYLADNMGCKRSEVCCLRKTTRKTLSAFRLQGAAEQRWDKLEVKLESFRLGV